MKPLTGRAAAEAIGLTMALGNANAGFDSRKLGKALRTTGGRQRILTGLRLAFRVPRIWEPRQAKPRRRAARRRLRVAHAQGPPGRPSRPPDPQEAA